jgi:hypothetical protein
MAMRASRLSDRPDRLSKYDALAAHAAARRTTGCEDVRQALDVASARMRSFHVGALTLADLRIR